MTLVLDRYFFSSFFVNHSQVIGLPKCNGDYSKRRFGQLYIKTVKSMSVKFKTINIMVKVHTFMQTEMYM